MLLTCFSVRAKLPAQLLSWKGFEFDVKKDKGFVEEESV